MIEKNCERRDLVEVHLNLEMIEINENERECCVWTFLNEQHLHLSCKSKKSKHSQHNWIQIKSKVCTYLHKRRNRTRTRTHWWTVACDTGCIQCWRAVAVVEDVVAVPLLGSPRNEHCCWVDDRHEIPQHCDEMTWWFFKWNWNCERWELWVVLES